MTPIIVKRSGIYLLLKQQKMEAEEKINDFIISRIKTRWTLTPFY